MNLSKPFIEMKMKGLPKLVINIFINKLLKSIFLITLLLINIVLWKRNLPLMF
ncbi:hypothetical protein QF028_000125 [Neobacillus sp. B4I6]